MPRGRLKGALLVGEQKSEPLSNWSYLSIIMQVNLSLKLNIFLYFI